MPKDNGSLAPALMEVLGLFDERSPLTNVWIAEELGISYRAAYKRTRRLRDAGYIRGVLNWLTINGEGMAAWRDSQGYFRTWLDLYPVDEPGEPDEIHKIFDSTKGAGNGKTS